MTREEKTQAIESLSEKLKENPNFYITNIEDLDSEKSSNLRRMCFSKDIKLMVVKNTLLRKALEKSDRDFEELFEILKGHTSVMFTEVGNAPAKMIKEFRKKYKSEKPLLKGAFIEESVYIGEDQLDVLENIKSKNELIGDIIALLQSPAKNVVSALQSGGQTLSGILKTLSEKEG